MHFYHCLLDDMIILLNIRTYIIHFVSHILYWLISIAIFNLLHMTWGFLPLVVFPSHVCFASRETMFFLSPNFLLAVFRRVITLFVGAFGIISVWVRNLCKCFIDFHLFKEDNCPSSWGKVWGEKGDLKQSKLISEHHQNMSFYLTLNFNSSKAFKNIIYNCIMSS